MRRYLTVELVVQDDGLGVADADRECAFDPAPAPLASAPQGSGYRLPGGFAWAAGVDVASPAAGPAGRPVARLPVL